MKRIEETKMNDNGATGKSKKSEKTAARIIKAVKETHGFLSAAAPRAGVGYRTIVRYANEYPSVIQAVQEAKEEMKDYAESKLFKQIEEGNLTAIIFYLKTQAKDRGYTERTEHTGKDGEGIQLIFKPASYDTEEEKD
jgi:hypothetical protein